MSETAKEDRAIGRKVEVITALRLMLSDAESIHQNLEVIRCRVERLNLEDDKVPPEIVVIYEQATALRSAEAALLRVRHTFDYRNSLTLNMAAVKQR